MQLRAIIYSRDGQTVLTPDDTTNGYEVFVLDVDSTDGLINGKNWCSTCHPQPMGGNKQSGCLAGNCHAQGNSSF